MPIFLLFLLAGVAAVAASSKPKKKKPSRKVIDALKAIDASILEVVNTDDFPHPYTYKDTLAMVRRLIPKDLNFAPSGGALDVNLDKSMSAMYGQLLANLAAVEAMKGPRWLKTTNLFYSVIWPFFASGVGGPRWFFKVPTKQSDALAKQYTAYAFWAFAWLLLPVNASVPRSVSLAEAIVPGSTAFDGTKPGNFRHPTKIEQVRALLELCWYTRATPPTFLAVDGAWWAPHADEGAARVQQVVNSYLNGKFDGSGAPSNEARLNACVALVGEAVRFSAETAALVNLQLEQEVKQKQVDDMSGETNVAMAVYAVVATVLTVGGGVVAGIAGGAATAASAGATAAAAEGASVGLAEAVSQAVTQAAVEVFGQQLGTWIAEGVVKLVELAIIAGIGAAMKELGQAELAVELGIGLSDADKQRLSQLAAQAGQGVLKSAQV